MSNNWLALILSFVLVFAILGSSTVLEKKGIFKEESSRKFIHIGVGNWWFFVIFLFDNVWFAIIPPIIFIILNYLSYRFTIIKSMERGNKSTNNLGTVYFPVSLLILTILSFTVLDPIIGGIGILVLGYGDGLAAVIGSKYKSKLLVNNKSLYGSIAMFVVSVIVAMLLIGFFKYDNILQMVLISLVIGLVASLTELFTPKGLDNLSVPLLVSLVAFLLFLI